MSVRDTSTGVGTQHALDHHLSADTFYVVDAGPMLPKNQTLSSVGSVVYVGDDTLAASGATVLASDITVLDRHGNDYTVSAGNGFRFRLSGGRAVRGGQPLPVIRFPVTLSDGTADAVDVEIHVQGAE